MLRGITIWLHLHSFHVLPSAAWIVLLIILQFVTVAGVLVSLLAAQRESLSRVLASTSLLEPILLRRALGAAAPTSLPFPERLLTIMDAQSVLLKVEIGILNFALSASTNDRPAFLAVMQKIVAKVGDVVEAKAEAALMAAVKGNPLLSEFASAFEPQVSQLIAQEVTSLESEATGSEDQLIAKGVLWIQADLADREAALAAEEAAASAPVSSALEEPVEPVGEPPALA